MRKLVYVEGEFSCHFPNLNILLWKKIVCTVIFIFQLFNLALTVLSLVKLAHDFFLPHVQNQTISIYQTENVLWSWFTIEKINPLYFSYCNKKCQNNLLNALYKCHLLATFHCHLQLILYLWRDLTCRHGSNVSLCASVTLKANSKETDKIQNKLKK